MEDIIKLIKKYKLKITPVLVEGVWAVGPMRVDKNKIMNYVPAEKMVKHKDLETAIKGCVLAIEQSRAKNGRKYVALNSVNASNKKKDRRRTSEFEYP